MNALYNRQIVRDIFVNLDDQAFKYHDAVSRLISTLDGKVRQADSIFIRER
jgi:hypothetical protein